MTDITSFANNYAIRAGEKVRNSVANRPLYLLKSEMIQISNVLNVKDASDWVNNKAYVLNDKVNYANIVYICVQANSNQNPSSTTGYWTPYQINSIGSEVQYASFNSQINFVFAFTPFSILVNGYDVTDICTINGTSVVFPANWIKQNDEVKSKYYK